MEHMRIVKGIEDFLNLPEDPESRGLSSAINLSLKFCLFGIGTLLFVCLSI